MNVFELAAQYRSLEAYVDADQSCINDDEILQSWVSVEGDLNHKIENIGFAIRNREAILIGKQEAIKAMESSAQSVEKEIERLKTLAINLMNFTQQKKAGGAYLTLSLVNNAPKVIIDDERILPLEYLREIPPVEASFAPDKKKIAADIKEGVVINGAHLEPSVRLSIK